MYSNKNRGVNIDQIAMCYTSLDLSRQALQTNGKFFFRFRIIFRINGRKPKNIQMNSEVWILIKLQCVIYQWIWLDKLYKLLKSFFQISE